MEDIDIQDAFGFDEDEEPQEFDYGEEEEEEGGGEEAPNMEAENWGREAPEMRRGFREFDLAGRERDMFLVRAEGRLEQQLLDPLSRFRNIVNAIANNFQQIGIELSEEHIIRLLATAEKLQYIEFKNPAAYILGFWVLENNQISIDRFQTLSRQFLKPDSIISIEYNISGVDVIRYARLWTLHLM